MRGVVVAIAENIAANVKIVVIPIVTRPGTWSIGICKENHPIITNSPDGKYVRKRWYVIFRLRTSCIVTRE